MHVQLQNKLANQSKEYILHPSIHPLIHPLPPRGGDAGALGEGGGGGPRRRGTRCGGKG